MRGLLNKQTIKAPARHISGKGWVSKAFTGTNCGKVMMMKRKEVAKNGQRWS